ncbi:MAG: carboxypeptidase-like regulatory domain-containing protein [Muribaculaceae bacterium]|nr:carboxypeptidase-like regulatory domain-containing protein [Muribaculaceae bacterium]
MKLKYIFLGVTAFVCAATSLQAQEKKDLQDLRIYLNPGHGGFDGGDRHMGTVKHGAATYLDTCGFYETNTNLWKGFATFQRLVEYGFKFDPTLNPFPENFVGYRCKDSLHDLQTNADESFRYGAARDMSQGIVMSHVKNGYSRNINEIAAEVEYNNFDLFLSIHSNAASEGSTVNYPAFFVRGENRVAFSAGSDAFARTVWPHAYANTHSQWSNYSMTNPAVYYDIDFWNGDYVTIDYGNGNKVKGYYAVLRHNVPGMLAEGYFHTYQPARHRAMNPDVCAIEGEAYARGIADWFGIEKEKTGSLYGIVRDLHEKFRHTFYNTSNSNPDAYLPINNAEIKLMDSTGTVVATYTTDDEYNGAFVFRNLTPGMYTIAVTAEGYKPADATYCGPFEVKAAETVYPCVAIESEAYEPPTTTVADYIDEINVPYIKAADNYEFRQAVVDKELPVLIGSTIKRFIVKGDKIYILAHDENKMPSIYVLDASTLEMITEVSTDGTQGTVNPLADIQVTADGVLVGSAAQLNFISADQMEPGEVMGECNFYKWTNDEKGLPTGNPEKWFGTTATANFYRAVTGFTFAYTGTSKEGSIVLPSYSTYYNRKVWLNVLDVVDGVLAGSRFVNSTRDLMNMDDLGDDVTVTISPVQSNSFIVNSSKVAPMQFSMVDYNLERKSADNHAANEGYFMFAGTPMMSVVDKDAQGNHGGVLLYSLKEGLSKASTIGTSNTAIEPIRHKSSAAAGRTVVTYDGEDNISAADIDLYTVRDNKISRFTTSGVEQPVVKGNYAFALKQSVENDVYTLSFELTDEADAAVELVPVDADASTVTVAKQLFEKGVNTVTVDSKEYDGDYTWRVVVENPAVPALATVHDSGIHSSGVAIDRNPESDMFGNIYVSQYGTPRQVNGFSATFEPLSGSPYMINQWDTSVGASPWRLAVLPTGKLLVSDWGDAQGGLYLYDPADANAKRSNFFAGTCKPASGEWTYNGEVIGGSTSGMAVVGTGEETKLISFQEDWPSDYCRNLVYYNIGTADQITQQPVQTEEFKTTSAYLINGNVDVLVHEKGMVLGQVRGGGNNSKGVPCFVITDPVGNIIYNSGSDWEGLTGSKGLFALSDDASLFLMQDDGRKIHVCALTWEPEFTLTELYSFDVLKDGGSDSNSYQACFDPAGNLYVANRSSMRVFTLPREAMQTVTPAKAEYVISGKWDSVDEIAVDGNVTEGPVRYYNLQGMEISGENIPAGIYIRKQGNQATKVIVR